LSLYINIYYLHHPVDYETEVLPWHQTAKVGQEWNNPFLIIYNAYVLLLYMLQLQKCLMRLWNGKTVANYYCCQCCLYTCACLRFLVLWVVQLIHRCGGKGILFCAFIAVPSPFNFPQFISVMAACLLGVVGAGSWLGHQILPAIRAVSILELSANSGSSRMSQAPNLHLVTQLFTHWVESDFKTWFLSIEILCQINSQPEVKKSMITSNFQFFVPVAVVSA